MTAVAFLRLAVILRLINVCVCIHDHKEQRDENGIDR